MAEIRLSKLIKQYNIGLATLVDFLNENGANVDLNPNSKVSDEYLPLLEERFRKDISLRDAAQKVDVRISHIIEKADAIREEKEAEAMTMVRVNKLMRQYNVGLGDLVSFLNERGAGLELNPNAKVPTSFLPSIQERFGADKTQRIKPGPVRDSLKASIAPEDFDWDTFEREVGVWGAEDKAKIKGAYDQTLSNIVENEVYEGIVTAINKREVVVNIDYKAEGVVSALEFRYNPDLKIGDKVEVYVENAADRRGQLVLSHKKARQLKSWDNVIAAYENNEIVKGYVKSRTKGGMIVDVSGIEAFLPGSQIDTKPIRDYDVFLGTTMDLKILKINQEFRNVIVSHKAIVEDEVNRKRAAFFSHLQKGQVLDGKVKSIVDYGVFVDLGIVDGLIHINNLGSGHGKSPKEVVSVGDTIKVTVLDFDKDIQRISLGLKQADEMPQTDSLAAKAGSETLKPESIFNEKALEMLKKQVKK